MERVRKIKVNVSEAIISVGEYLSLDNFEFRTKKKGTESVYHIKLSNTAFFRMPSLMEALGARRIKCVIGLDSEISAIKHFNRVKYMTKVFFATFPEICQYHNERTFGKVAFLNVHTKKLFEIQEHSFASQVK